MRATRQMGVFQQPATHHFTVWSRKVNGKRDVNVGKDRKDGIMEYWNAGITGKRLRIKISRLFCVFPSFLPSIYSVPSFQCSIIPVQQEGSLCRVRSFFEEAQAVTNVDNSRVRMHTGFVIILKSPREIGQIRKANTIVAEILQNLRKLVSPGVITRELERVADEIILAKGAVSAFKGYRGFPGSICISINEAVVHGIAGNRRLKEGDIVSLDVGVKLNGYFGDAAITVPVGEVDPASRRLVEVTEKALTIGIKKAKAGNRLFDISHAIQVWVEENGFSVVRDFVGHGIGRDLHEDPQIPNFGSPHQGPRLEEGMVLALEPMVNEGTHPVRILDDGWTVVTTDGKRSAHFEHTIVITEGDAEILTQL
jgi:methionyl aminopeptidase